MMCAGTVSEARRYKVVRVQRCQNKGIHFVQGVALCGTHYNAADVGPIEIITTFAKDW